MADEELNVIGCLHALFEAYCKEHNITGAGRESVKSQDWVQWIAASPLDTTCIIDGLRETRSDLSSEAWDSALHMLTQPDSQLIAYQLWPMLCLSHRTCTPPVVWAELSLTLRYADNVNTINVVHIGGDPSGKVAVTDGPLSTALLRSVVSLFHIIRQNPLQTQHDRALAEARRVTDSVGTLAQQPIKGGFIP